MSSIKLSADFVSHMLPLFSEAVEFFWWEVKTNFLTQTFLFNYKIYFSDIEQASRLGPRGSWVMLPNDSSSFHLHHSASLGTGRFVSLVILTATRQLPVTIEAVCFLVWERGRENSFPLQPHQDSLVCVPSPELINVTRGISVYLLF